MEKATKAQRCFSLAFYITTNGNNKKGSTAQAQLFINTTEGKEIMVKAQLDTGGSQNLASRELLQNINTTAHSATCKISLYTATSTSRSYLAIPW
jgi:hypothetical protein